MKIRVFQKGFNFSQDGPGNRLVYHLQGCNMHCPWCANPEGLTNRGVLMAKREQLDDSLCPHGAIVDRQFERERCVDCATRDCLHAHRNQALRWSCSEVEVEDLVAEAKRSASLFFGGGGVTLSGGEPTLQFAAVRKLLTRLRAEGIHTALETNATHSRLAELLPLIDYLIVDYKHPDDKVLRDATGVGTRPVERNLAHILESGRSVLIRIPLIGGFNDASEDLQGFLAYFRTLPSDAARFEFLTFHEFGKGKWEQCGLSYDCAGSPVAAATVRTFIDSFTANHLQVVHT